MKSLCPWIGIILLLFTLSCKDSDKSGIPLKQSSSQKIKVVELLQTGEYLRQDYMQSIRQTRSPLKSIKAGEPQLIIVSNRAQSLQLMVIYNFHEGGERFKVSADGKITPEAGVRAPNLSLQILSPKKLKLGYGSHQNMTFEYVGSAEEWVASNVLAGRYIDSQGRAYTFGAEGKAVFPETTFAYHIGLDHMDRPYEYIRAMNSIYSFRMKGNQLELFETSGENHQDVSKTPKWTLKKVKEEKGQKKQQSS